jgi:hypothetical protein
MINPPWWAVRSSRAKQSPPKLQIFPVHPTHAIEPVATSPEIFPGLNVLGDKVVMGLLHSLKI